ncbi:unnamed protein product [Heligmosomoides polygyrus]|uniref:Uncharacterized protein n=1 Tax=Heligmosomoides polygyrus TaxID=6339 RepID=A0A183GGP8_HELPZ|nr:unnamed protein product [Heligmosomoides polygyrus]
MRCTENKVVENEREGSSCDFSRAVTVGYNCRRNLQDGDGRDTSSCTVGTGHYEAWAMKGRQAGMVVDNKREGKGLREEVALSRVSRRKDSRSLAEVPRSEESCKEAVAVTKATHYGDVNEKLESGDGEQYLYRLAKNRYRQTEDIEKFFGINDENGRGGDVRSSTWCHWKLLAL